MIEVTGRCGGDRSERWDMHVGYFGDEKEAMIALRGLCPWDFNPMAGYSSYKDFNFKYIPANLTADYDIAGRNKVIEKAKMHAQRPSWHTRSPADWE